MNRRGVNIASLIIILVLALILILLLGKYVLGPSKAIINDLGTRFGLIAPAPKPIAPEDVGPILSDKVSIVQVSSASGEIPVQQPDKIINAGLLTPEDSPVVSLWPITIIFDRPISGSKDALTVPDVQLLYCDFTPSSRCRPTVLQWCKAAAPQAPGAKAITQFGTEPLSTIYSYYDNALRSGVGGAETVVVYGGNTETKYPTLRNAIDLTEGGTSGWITLKYPISNKYSDLNFKTAPAFFDGDPVTQYQFKKVGGKLQIQFRDGDYLGADMSDWYDFASWNNYPSALLASTVTPCVQELDGKTLVIPNLPGNGWYQITIQPVGNVFVRGVGVKQELPMNTNQVIRFKYQG